METYFRSGEYGRGGRKRVRRDDPTISKVVGVVVVSGFTERKGVERRYGIVYNGVSGPSAVRLRWL